VATRPVEAEKFMKKLMTALAICAVAGFGLAQSVTSANMVAYNTITVPAGQSYIILGNGLRTVNAGNTNSIDLLDFIPNPQAAGFTAGTTLGSSDQVWFWYQNGYQQVYLYNTTGPITSRRGKWLNNATWAGGGANAATTFKLKAGDAVWLKRASTNNTIAFQTLGEVVNDASITHTVTNGFNFISSNFAADWDINDGTINWQGVGATAGTTLGSSDQIWFWYQNGYQQVYLYNTTGPITSRRGKWLNNATWAGGGANAATTYKMPFGYGAWYKRFGAGQFTYTQTRPYTP